MLAFALEYVAVSSTGLDYYRVCFSTLIVYKQGTDIFISPEKIILHLLVE